MVRAADRTGALREDRSVSDARGAARQRPLLASDTVRAVFVEVVEGPVSDWELVRQHSRLIDDPPDGLLACVVTPVGDDGMHAVMVWETPGQRGDWAAAVMMPLFESGALADLTSKPAPVTPIDVFVRPTSGDD